MKIMCIRDLEYSAGLILLLLVFRTSLFFLFFVIKNKSIQVWYDMNDEKIEIFFIYG